MKLMIARRESAYHIPRAAVAAAALIVVLGLVAAWHGVEDAPVLCPFRAATGLPCPTCGLMRATGHLLRGDAAAAFSVNPLAAAILVSALPLGVALAASNRRGGMSVRVHATRGERLALRAALVVVVLVNWVYVLATHA
jgi:hypothetical protein